MKIVLLAAGLGTRLRPLTDQMPKCLAPIQGKPLLEYWLEKISVCDKISEVLVNTHYFSEQVESFLLNYSFDKKIKIVFEEELLGTAGTLKANRNWFDGEEDFIVIHADNFSALNLSEFIEAHKKRPAHCVMTMGCFETDKPENCGIVSVDDQGCVQAFYEKSQEFHGTRANGAVYVCSPQLLTSICDVNQAHFGLSEDIIPNLIGKIFTYQIEGHHIDIGTLQTYELAQEI